MSKRLVTKEIPDIIPVAEMDLSRGEIFMLIHTLDHNIAEPFVICRRGRETILINRELPNIEDVILLINKIMTERYLDRAEPLFDEFEKLCGKDASKTLLYIWLDWRKEIEAVAVNKRAMDALGEIRKSRLTKKAKKEMNVIRELFSIGLEASDNTECFFDKGEEYTFLYGYLQGMKAVEAQKARAEV